MKNNKTIAQGAEAIISKNENIITKNRIKKSYRHPLLDEKIRKLRTRAETKLLEKARELIPTPKIISSSDKSKTIEMQFIKGKKLSEHLENLDYKKITKEIGNSLAKLHDYGIIHGDLTTSNLIFCSQTKKVYFIDFGLGFHSNKTEDKAVDLHLIKEALSAKHPTIFEKAFSSILKGYKSSKNYSQVIKQLEKVELRGRYKAQY